VIAVPFLNLDYSNWIEEYNELISRVTVEGLNLGYLCLDDSFEIEGKCLLKYPNLTPSFCQLLRLRCSLMHRL
jgi:hypothetical protein